MRKLALMMAICALAACGGGDADEADLAPAAGEGAVATDENIDPQAEAGFEAVAPGSYEVVHEDGSIDQLRILPGMTWAMVFADGTPAGGTIFAQGGENCFVTEGVEGHQCFRGTEPEPDGSMEVTAEDGEVMTVRPVDSFE